MRSMVASAVVLCVLLMATSAGARGMNGLRMEIHNLHNVNPGRLASDASCMQSHYYLLQGCPYVTVLEGVEADGCFGVCFSMLDTVYWHPPCDTTKCLTLDVIELVLYDVLAPPADQSMNVKVLGADCEGEPIGGLLGNLDFTPSYADSAAFTSVEVDFTNGGGEPGLDLSGCGGRFVVILTWKNPTGHPALVLDNIGTCVDSCGVNSACCAMGTYPYIYPRKIHTYCYGTEWAWSKQDSIPDLGGCETYGCLEAFWTCGFCTKTTATEPTTWGSIKALYQ
jgi:hypothetical protein